MESSYVLGAEGQFEDLGRVEADRRGADRFRLVYRAARVRHKDEVGLWCVRNISDRGIMLEPPHRVAPGDELDIALSDKVTVKARAVWSGNGRCGALFDQAIDCPLILKQLADERRSLNYRPPRIPAMAKVTTSSELGFTPVQLHDLSQYGVGFTHDGRFQPGMWVKLHFACGAVRQGVVRWSREGRAGLFLTEPLSLAELAGLIGPSPPD